MAMPGRVINPGLQRRSMSEKFMSEKVIYVYENDNLRSAMVNAMPWTAVPLTTGPRTDKEHCYGSADRHF